MDRKRIEEIRKILHDGVLLALGGTANWKIKEGDLRLMDEVDELCSLALQATSNMTEWRPIETAPRDGSEVLTLFRGSCRNGTFVYMGGNPISGKKWPIFNSPEGLLFAPSHWMPISHPSEDEK